VESVRNVVLNGNMASVNWYMLWGYGLLFYLAGFFFFHKTKKGFADVI
jgi:ABC-type polysaccharide/polyol phosphate export permease